jgi:hypothetical protein
VSDPTPDYKAQAIAEFRTAHPEHADIPDDALADNVLVQSRILGLAFLGFFRTLATEWDAAMSRFRKDSQ